jgi:uncharacterized membrane protein YkoI
MHDMGHFQRSIALAALALTIAGGWTAALAYTGQELEKRARISLQQARTVALKAVPGRITDEELEREGGGLRYSFDISYRGATHEVGVDALTGRLIENSIEGAHPD